MSTQQQPRRIEDIYMQLWNRKLFDKRLRALGVIAEPGAPRPTGRRTEGQLSQRDLAAMVGWNSHTILTRIIKGEVNTVDDKKAIRLAFILGVGVDDLFEARSSTGSAQNANRQKTRKVAA